MTSHQNATSQNTSQNPANRLASVLRAENDFLRDGDAAAATRLLPEKQAATAALQASLPGMWWNREEAARLDALAAENRTRLTLAIEIQATILEMVARAARLAVPGPVSYRADGAVTSATAALALRIRA